MSYYDFDYYIHQKTQPALDKLDSCKVLKNIESLSIHGNQTTCVPYEKLLMRLGKGLTRLTRLSFRGIAVSSALCGKLKECHNFFSPVSNTLEKLLIKLCPLLSVLFFQKGGGAPLRTCAGYKYYIKTGIKKTKRGHFSSCVWDTGGVIPCSRSVAGNWTKGFTNLKELSLNPTSPCAARNVAYAFREALKSSGKTLEYLSFALPKDHFIDELDEEISHPLQLLLDPSYRLTKLKTLEMIIPFYSGVCDAFVSDTVLLRAKSEMDVRTIKIGIKEGNFGEMGTHSDVIALFRVLNAMSPNLEHFEWNKNIDSLNIFLRNWVEYTMDILESLPISLKTLFTPFTFPEMWDLDVLSEELKELEKRMGAFFGLFRNLKRIRFKSLFFSIFFCNFRKIEKT